MSGEEPTITLSSGAVVLVGVYECVRWLRDAGYSVALDDDDNIVVDPQAHREYPDSCFIVESCSNDTRAILHARTA